jgi:hypothetical protein
VNTRPAQRFTIFLLLMFISCSLISAGHAQESDSIYRPVIPKTWDEQALTSLEVPLAEASCSPKHISAEAYYRIPVRPIYKSYPSITRTKNRAVIAND